MSGPTIIAPPAGCPAGYRLKFKDDFNVFDYSADRSGVHAWYEGVWFNAGNPQTDVSVRNSVLTLGWRPGMPLEVDVTSLVSWRYGYFEARMRWDDRPGVWPAFWLIPLQGDGSAENGEIDVVEAQYSAQGVIYSTIHDWTGPGLSTDARAKVNNTVPLAPGFRVDNWHRYGVLWTPGAAGAAGKAQFYLDGVATISASLPAVYDTQDYLLVLTLTVGDNWVDSEPPVSEPLGVYVDSVEVWQAG